MDCDTGGGFGGNHTCTYRSLKSSLFGLKQQWSSFYFYFIMLSCGINRATVFLVLVHYLTAEKQICGDQETHYVDNLLFYIQHKHLFPQAL